MSSVSSSIASDAGLQMVLGERKTGPTAPFHQAADENPTLVNPDAEVNDIDRRLQQLQMFLQQAKRGMDLET
eukprot:scaffold301_cov243-Pinguiococcus_pyrenoidosus.AAC.161